VERRANDKVGKVPKKAVMRAHSVGQNFHTGMSVFLIYESGQTFSQ
jgi:hypothetical protein